MEYRNIIPVFMSPIPIDSWTLSGGGTFTTSGDTANVTWTTTGFHTLFLTSSNHCGNGLQKFLTVEVRPPSPTDTPAINNTGRWLYSSLAPAWSGYQWYRNGSLIAGATNAAYYASLAGAYTIRYANFCGNGPGFKHDQLCSQFNTANHHLPGHGR